MATAVEPSSEPRTPSEPISLPLASLLGALYVALALAAVFYAVPSIWSQFVSSSLAGYQLLSMAMQVVVQVVVAFVLWWFGQTLAGENPPQGLRGGIFLMFSWAIAIFFLVKRVGFWTQGTSAGEIITGVVLAFLLFMAIRFFTGGAGTRWSIGLENQGWFHTHQYKKALGQKVRRLTILGFLLIGGTGVYSLMYHGMIGEQIRVGERVTRVWRVSIPFTTDGGFLEGRIPSSVTVISGAEYVIPILLFLLTLWIAWRIVNMPSFAEFLIATEAEMNKVSWTSKKRLAQDTVVVIVTTVLLTVFLLVVDFFWSWLLSRELVGVLPKLQDARDQEQVQQAKW